MIAQFYFILVFLVNLGIVALYATGHINLILLFVLEVVSTFLTMLIYGEFLSALNYSERAPKVKKRVQLPKDRRN